MTVLHITSVHGRSDTRIFHRECVTLVEAGYRTLLIAPGEMDETVSGVRILGISKRPGRLGRALLTTWAAYRRALRTDAAVVHFHDPELIPVALLLRLRGRRVVYDVHEYYSEIIPLRVSPWLRPLVRVTAHLFLERAPLKLFDHLVFPTTLLRDEYAPAERSTVLYNYPRLGEGAPDVPARDRTVYDVIFTGTVSPFRARVMLDVARALSETRPDFRWLFVGIADATVAWAREHYPADFLERHIAFRSRVPYAEVLKYLSQSRVGYNYHPLEKRFEVAVPMKVYEYMLTGIPVVTSALPELTVVLEDGGDVVFPASDEVGDHVAAVAGLLDDSERAARIGEAGRRTVVDRLNWDVSEAPKLLALYERLTARGAETS